MFLALAVLQVLSSCLAITQVEGRSVKIQLLKLTGAPCTASHCLSCLLAAASFCLLMLLCPCCHMAHSALCMARRDAGKIWGRTALLNKSTLSWSLSAAAAACYTGALRVARRDAGEHIQALLEGQTLTPQVRI